MDIRELFLPNRALFAALLVLLIRLVHLAETSLVAVALVMQTSE